MLKESDIYEKKLVALKRTMVHLNDNTEMSKRELGIILNRPTKVKSIEDDIDEEVACKIFGQDYTDDETNPKNSKKSFSQNSDTVTFFSKFFSVLMIIITVVICAVALFCAYSVGKYFSSGLILLIAIPIVIFALVMFTRAILY